MKVVVALAVFVALVCMAGPAASWSPPSAVAWTPYDSLDPRVVVDSNGKAHVVWREKVDGAIWRVWYANDSAGWFGSPVTVSQSGSVGGYNPVVAADAGDIHFAWTADVTGSNFEIWYRKLSGANWSPIYCVSNTAIKSLRPAIAVRGTVGPVVSWDEALWADDNYDVLFADWNGSGFNPSFNVSNTPGGAVYGSVNSNIAVSPNGDVTVVWAERISGDYHVNARRRVGGVWQPRQEISTKQTGPSTPGIAVGSDNQVHVVYNADNANWYQKWNGSQWTAPVALPGGVSNLLRPKIAVDGRGFCHVIADNSSYGVGDVYYTTNSSGSWSAWTNISNTPNTNSLAADISCGGNMLAVVWIENSNGSGGTGVFNIWYTKHALPPEGPYGTITGIVQDQFGTGIANATVSAGPYETTSGAGGTYTLNVAPATYDVTAAKLHYTSQTVRGVSVAQNQTVTLNLTITANPPAPVTSFTITPSDGVNRLAWTNPTSANFAGTMIRVKTTGYPTSPIDGTLVCDNAGLPGSSDGFTHSGLTNGITYYYSAFTHDSDGHYSSAVNRASTPHLLTCREVKDLPDSTTADLNGKVVTAVFSSDSCIYVEDPDRTSGIRVATSQSGLAIGDRVNITGTVSTRIVSGYPSERQVSATSVTKVSSGTPLKPIAMGCEAVGGATVGLVPGVKNGIGTNNMGLLVKICGKVTKIIGSYIFVDDGSKVENVSGSGPEIGVMVRCATTPTFPVGSIVSATGIIEGSIPTGWTVNRRYIRARDASDVVVYANPSLGAISGQVTDSYGTVLAGATVSTNLGGYSATTSQDGKYTISGVASGTYTVTASKSGYQTQAIPGVEVSSGRTTIVNFTLMPNPTEVLANGNFDGGFVDFWGGRIASSWNPCYRNQSSADNTEWTDLDWGAPHNLSQQVYVSLVGTGESGVMQRVTGLTPGRNFKFSCYAYQSNTNSTCWIAVDPNGGTTLPARTTSFANIAAQWNYQEVTGTVGASGTVSVFLWVWHQANPPSYCWFDDASLTVW